MLSLRHSIGHTSPFGTPKTRSKRIPYFHCYARPPPTAMCALLVFDPSGFPKSGRESVGVARQWCGRLGKVDNCQVAIYLGYVSRKGHTLVDTRLYLPKEWTKDKARLDKAGVPKACRAYRTRHQLALEMLAENGTCLPHRWIAGDDEMGRPSWFRR